MTASLDTPQDFTITVNVLHQVLNSLSEYFPNVIVDDCSLFQSRVQATAEEWSWSKVIAMSLHTGGTIAPILLEGRKTSTAYVKSPIREKWHRLLSTTFPFWNVVYFAIPLVTDPDRLDSVLARTVFVDIHDIPIGTTKLSVPARNQYVFSGSDSDGSIQLRGPVCYCYNGQHYRLAAESVHGWIDIREALTECEIGFPLTADGKTVTTPVSDRLENLERQVSQSGSHHLHMIQFGYRDQPPSEPPWSGEPVDWDSRLVTHE